MNPAAEFDQVINQLQARRVDIHQMRNSGHNATEWFRFRWPSTRQRPAIEGLAPFS
jgi:hypothetical protein